MSIQVYASLNVKIQLLHTKREGHAEACCKATLYIVFFFEYISAACLRQHVRLGVSHRDGHRGATNRYKVILRSQGWTVRQIKMCAHTNTDTHTVK